MKFDFKDARFGDIVSKTVNETPYLIAESFAASARFRLTGNVRVDSFNVCFWGLGAETER